MAAWALPTKRLALPCTVAPLLSLRLPVPRVAVQAETLGLQQRLVGRREVQPLAAMLVGAHVAALPQHFGPGGIAEDLDIGENVCSGEHDVIFLMDSLTV
jgi:hypothetical protein